MESSKAEGLSPVWVNSALLCAGVGVLLSSSGKCWGEWGDGETVGCCGMG